MMDITQNDAEYAREDNTPPTRQSSPIARFAAVWIPLVLIVSTFLVYLNALDNELLYSWDDNRYIGENTLIQEFDVVGIFTEFYFAAYLPITLLTYAIEYSIWGMGPEGYHVTNVIFHALNSVLVFYFVRRLQGHQAVALIAAILWAIHPVQVESVAWVGQRKSVVSMFFFLLAFLAHMYSSPRNAEDKHYRPWLLVVGWVCFALAIGAKPTAVGAPILFILYDYFWTNRLLFEVPRLNGKFNLLDTAKAWLERPLHYIHIRNIPYGIIGVAGAILIVLAHDEGGGIKTPLGDTLWDNIKLNVNIYFEYFLSLVYPFDLNNMYQYDMTVIENGQMTVWFGFLFVIALGLVAVFQPFGKRYSFFAVVWVVIFMLPVSNIIPIAIQRADRYMYYPTIIIFMLAGVGIVALWQRISNLSDDFSAKAILRTLVTGGLAIFLVICTVITVQRNTVWQNSGTLWADHLTDYPTSDTGLLNAGVYHWREGNGEQAAALFTSLVETYPRHAKGNRFLAYVLDDLLDDEAAAIPYYLVAIERAELSEPNLVPSLENKLGMAYFSVGLARFNTGDTQAALDNYLQAAQLIPNNPTVYNNLGFTYQTIGQLDVAINYYRSAIQRDPEYALAYGNLANTALADNQFQLAKESYEMALALSTDFGPDLNSKYCLTLGELQTEQATAYAACEAAIAEAPQDGFILARYAYVQLQFGELDAALASAQAAEQLDPSLSLSYRVQGDVYRLQGDTAAARERYEVALQFDPNNGRAIEGLELLDGGGP